MRRHYPLAPDEAEDKQIGEALAGLWSGVASVRERAQRTLAAVSERRPPVPDGRLALYGLSAEETGGKSGAELFRRLPTNVVAVPPKTSAVPLRALYPKKWVDTGSASRLPLVSVSSGAYMNVPPMSLR